MHKVKPNKIDFNNADIGTYFIILISTTIQVIRISFTKSSIKYRLAFINVQSYELNVLTFNEFPTNSEHS